MRGIRRGKREGRGAGVFHVFIPMFLIRLGIFVGQLRTMVCWGSEWGGGSIEAWTDSPELECQ